MFCRWLLPILVKILYGMSFSLRFQLMHSLSKFLETFQLFLSIFSHTHRNTQTPATSFLEILFIIYLMIFVAIADKRKTFSWLRVSISSTFYGRIFWTNVVSAVFSSYILALSKNMYKKRAHIMLMKLTTGVDFTNILRKAFTQVNPRRTKNTVKPSVFLSFWDLRT